MSKSENDIKIQMLNEFETQVDNLFDCYNERKLTFEDLKKLLKNLKIIWDCCRVDIKNFGGQSSYIRVLSSLDDFTLSYPGWFNDNNGQGCKIEGQGHLDELKIQCNSAGKLIIDMRGLDSKNSNDERIPIYINYTKFSINNKTIFDENKLVWHNQPFVYSKESKKDDIYIINLEYKTIFTYFHHLTTFFNNPKDIETAKKEYKLLKGYIASERNLLEIEINQKEPNITSQQEQLITLKKNMDMMTQKYDTEITTLKEDLNKYRETNYEFLNTLFIFCDVKAKGLLKYVHLLNIELLDFIVKICDKYDLDYWLDFGLLLGAVRHNGFIPWDDDLDIGMMRKDYDKLVEVIESEIEENGLSDVLRISLNMHQFKPLPILQLLYYSEEVGDSIIAGIDIFPYDYIEDISNCDESTYKMIQQRVSERNLEGMPIEEALKEYYGYFDLRDEPAKYILPGVEGARGIFYGYDFKIFNTKDIYPLKMMKFGDNEYKVPCNYDEYLSQTYGNYLNIPKTIHHHQDRYEQYRLREDVNEIFDKNIEKIRKINEKME